MPKWLCFTLHLLYDVLSITYTDLTSSFWEYFATIFIKSYSEPAQKSKMKLFVEIFNGFKCFFFCKKSSEYASVYNLWRPYKVISRSSHHKCYIKEAVLKYFAIFTGKYLCCSFCLIKLQRSGTLKKEAPTQVFSCEYCKFFRNR